MSERKTERVIEEGVYLMRGRLRVSEEGVYLVRGRVRE